jgi:hypothetical protein
VNKSDVEILILRTLYEAYFLPDIDVDIKNLLAPDVWNDIPISNLINQMIHDGIIRGWRQGIAPFGAYYAENKGIAPEELKKKNLDSRILILNALAKVYEDQGNLYSAGSDEIAQQIGLDKKLVTDNLRVLMALGHVESRGNARFRITNSGLTSVERFRVWAGISEEFERISNMLPQPRGRALQKLLARIIGHHGWGQDEGVRTSNEEMDVIVFREREYYLLESKWEKEPIEADVIRELFGKLGNRIDVRGIVVSMSGFTGGAVKQVEDYTAQRIILLFGTGDVKAMIYGQATFEGLLNEKYKELITKRKVAFD